MTLNRLLAILAFLLLAGPVLAQSYDADKAVADKAPALYQEPTCGPKAG